MAVVPPTAARIPGETRERRIAARAPALLRDADRGLLASAGVVFALASAGAAMTAAAADAMFLAEIGPSRLGGAVAASNALLAVVLAIAGGLSDRLDRRRVLASLALLSALVVAGLAALSIVLPSAAAVLTLIGGKQLAAATDLAFWVVIAERLDARRSQRLLPILAATGGAGAAVGAVLVIPIASLLGARGVLVAAAALLALAGTGAARLAATRRVANPIATSSNPLALVGRAWRDGARAVRRHPLAMHLAVVVAAAGVFGSLAYFALGVALSAKSGDAGSLASMLGGVRGAGQILTLVVQLAIAPRLLARVGTGPALLLAPLVALASGIGLALAPILAMAIAMQMSARVLDAGIETPAEKLAQTLVPTAVRGRIAGFLDGTAKRAGAVVGGLLAAMLAGSPTAFFAVAAIAAALWLIAASRIARELPALAIEHVSRVDDAEAVVDDRAVEALIGELAGPRPERAAEVLVRLHERGRIEAAAPLARAVATRGNALMWRSLIAVLDEPVPACGPELLAAATRAAPRDRELAFRAVGLAGGVPSDALSAIAADGDAATELAREIAALRLADRRDDAIATLGDCVREPTIARAAIDELGCEIASGLALHGPVDTNPALGAARHLARALRRGRGDGNRAAAFGALGRVAVAFRATRTAELSLLRTDLLELARERVEQGASALAPPEALTSLVRRPATATDDAPETAAALRLLGDLLDGADTIDPEDLRRVTHALGEPDDAVRAAAEAALEGLGPAAAGELLATVAWGRRRARDRAAALLHDLPVTAAVLDRLVDAELDALEQTNAALAVMSEPGDELVARRLDERLHEIAHTVLLLVAASRRSRAIERAAVAWRHARGPLERARTLAVIEAALPRALVGRLVEAVDDKSPADRAAGLAAVGIVPQARETIVRAELAGRDRLARALVLHAIGAVGRSAHRDTIAEAARAEVHKSSPVELLRRISHAVVFDDDSRETAETDMPSRVETLIALGRVPLLAALSTRQLADVAERARWATARAGSVVVGAGDVIDALIVVEDGELALGDRAIGKGEVVDELACVAPTPARADLRAVRATRLIRLERVDFEELVDDVPGLAAAVCRSLGERARRAEDAAYRSPLTSKV